MTGADGGGRATSPGSEQVEFEAIVSIVRTRSRSRVCSVGDTGADDGAVVLWDADSGALLNRVLPGRPTDGWMSPRFLADEHTVLIAALGGAAYTMDTRPEHWIEVACTIAGRSLTAEEWSDAFDDRPYRATCPRTGQA